MMPFNTFKRDTLMVSLGYLKYQVTQEDVDRGRKDHRGVPSNGSGTVGIASTSTTTTIVGTATTFTYYRNSNYLQVAPDIIGINKVFQYNATLGNGIYNVKYQFMSMTFLVFGVVMVMPVVMILHHIQ